MPETMDDGAVAYTVEGSDRAVFAAGQCAIKFVGGDDGPLVVVMPEDEAVRTAMQLLVSPGPRLQALAAPLKGTEVGRDPSTGNMVLSLTFEGGGRFHVVFNEDQERQFYEAPRLPPLRSSKPN